MRSVMFPVMAFMAAASLSGAARAAVVHAAYDDFFAPNSGVANTGTYTSGTNPLVDVTTGNSFGSVAVNFAGAGTGNNNGGITLDSTYELYQVFNGYVNPVGYQNITGSIANALVFTGLNPANKYDLVIGTQRNTGNMGATIQNVQSFTNATTASTTTKLGVTTTSYLNYDGVGFQNITDPALYATANTSIAFDDGKIVLHFTDIVPNIDSGTGLGTFSVNMQDYIGGVSQQYNADYNVRWSAFRLQETAVPEPASLGLLGLGSLALLRRRR
jgi:hypothetical protein